METDQKLWYLKNLDLFDGIPDKEMMALARQVRECQYQKDELIYTPHDELSSVYVVKRGEVRLYHSSNGKRRVFDVLGPGSLFGGHLFGSKESTHFAQATHPTRVCIFSESDFLNVLRSKPELMLVFLKKITERMREYESRLQHRSDTAEELVLSNLRDLQEKRRQSLFGRWTANRLYVTHEELAELTGLNRVTVTRTLKHLKELGSLRVEKSSIVLL